MKGEPGIYYVSYPRWARWLQRIAEKLTALAEGSRRYTNMDGKRVRFGK